MEVIGAHHVISIAAQVNQRKVVVLEIVAATVVVEATLATRINVKKGAIGKGGDAIRLKLSRLWVSVVGKLHLVVQLEWIGKVNHLGELEVDERAFLAGTLDEAVCFLEKQKIISKQNLIKN